MKFTYTNPTVIEFGQGQTAAIAKHIAAEQKVLVIYGGGSIKRNGVYDQVAESLKGHQWLEFSGVEPNPTVETLNKAVALVKREGVDFILAVGGGSVIDGSKYVAAAAHYDGEGWDILEGKYTPQTAVPLGAVLTLPATGSESNASAVITRAATQDKMPFIHPVVQPVFAVLDPDVCKTLPQRQLANGLVDAWVHVCEQYLTFPQGAMVQDGYAESLLKSLLVLGKSFEKQDDVWRANLMWVANQALNGLIGSGVSQDWATHMIGHEITALHGVDHARSLAIVQPWLLRNQLDKKRDKLEQMGQNVFMLEPSADLAERTIQAIESFYLSVGMEIQLKGYDGSKPEVVEALVSQLEQHGMTKLGEHQAITLERSKEIIMAAVAG